MVEGPGGCPGDIDAVVGEGSPAVTGHGDPDRVIRTRAERAAHGFALVRDPVERRVDDVRARVDRQISNLVVRDEVAVRCVDRARVAPEARAGVEAAVDVDIRGGDVVVRRAHLGATVGREPLPVVEGDLRAGGIQPPVAPPVGARAHVDVREAQARDVDVVEAARVLHRGHSQVGVAAAGSERVPRTRAFVRRRERAKVASAVARDPGVRPAQEAVLGGGEEATCAICTDRGLSGGVGAAPVAARADRPGTGGGRGGESEAGETPGRSVRRPARPHARRGDQPEHGRQCERRSETARRSEAKTHDS